MRLELGKSALASALAVAMASAPGLAQVGTAFREGSGGPVSRGEASYQEGDYSRAGEAFREARREEPRNARAALLLGLTYLREDAPAKAAREWRDFVRLSDDPSLKRDVSQYVTVLLSDAYERGAEAALARERELTAAGGDPQTVAIASFENAGTEEYAPLGKAFAAMLTDNLSALQGIKVLEREQVQALVDEARLAESGLVKRSTVVRAGKLLRAGKVAAGSHADYERSPRRLKVGAVLVGVDDGKRLAKAEEEAPAEQFYVIVPKISAAFVPALVGTAVSALPAQTAARVLEEHTRNLDAAVSFGRVLDAKDRKDGEAAADECKKVQRLDPNFELARRNCLVIPPVWISNQAIAAAVESQVLGAVAGTGLGVGAMIGLGALAAGGIAAGVVVATDGNGGGGGGGGGLRLDGVSDRSVLVGELVALDLICRDPEGTNAAIRVENPPAGSTLDAQSGNPATASFRFVPSGTGNLLVRFTCVDGGTPPESVGRFARIEVRARDATPRPTSPLEPTPPPPNPATPSVTAVRTATRTPTVTPVTPGAPTSPPAPPPTVTRTFTPPAPPTSTSVPTSTPTPPPLPPTPTATDSCAVIGAPCSSDSDCCSNCCSSGTFSCQPFSACGE